MEDKKIVNMRDFLRESLFNEGPQLPPQSKEHARFILREWTIKELEKEVNEELKHERPA